MKKLKDPKSGLKHFIIIASYQEPVIGYMLSSSDKFKISELYEFENNQENTYNMHNLNKKEDFSSLIKFFISEFRNDDFKIEDNLEKFLLSKTFNGNPLLIQDLLNKIIDKELIGFDSKGTLRCTDNLKEMIESKDFSKLEIPYRFEKLMGNIIDTIKNPNEIIILKAASVIGNIFDIITLYQINPIKNLMNEDLLKIVYYFERINVLEILYDIEPDKLVAKFSLPFLREVLYSRMLSEQKTAIHSEIARNFKNMKFSYMSSEKELENLLRHLIESENTVMNVMDKRREDQSKEKQIENKNENKSKKTNSKENGELN
jgi:adenylate cyclase 10